MTRHVPSCLGITPIPEQWKGWNGGYGNGPAMRPCAHSCARYLSITSGCCNAEGRFGIRTSPGALDSLCQSHVRGVK